MVTRDDREFCLAISCEGGLQSSRLTYYMYVWQMLGFNIQFRYRLQSCGFCSNDCSTYVNEAVGVGDFNIDNMGYITPADHMTWYEEVPFSLEVIEILNNVKLFLDRLDQSDLELLCLSDLLITTVIQKKSAEALVTEQESIKSTLKTFCSSYTEEDFDSCISFMRQVKAYKETITRG